jgi:NAD(P)-dependent dehydrogenase (short-subunit alcohol dehydrogenase family)
MDVTDPAQVQAAASEVGSLDILINNAGVMLPDTPFDPAVLERHLAVNLYGAYAMTQALLPALISSRGAVVNLLSCVALAPLPMFTSYSASKAAAFSLTKTLRAGHAAQGVRFHALAGPIDTDMTRDLNIPKTSPEAVAKAIFDAVEREVEEIFPDPAAAPLAEAWAAGPDKILERQFALLVPTPEAASCHLPFEAADEAPAQRVKVDDRTGRRHTRAMNDAEFPRLKRRIGCPVTDR